MLKDMLINGASQQKIHQRTPAGNQKNKILDSFLKDDQKLMQTLR